MMRLDFRDGLLAGLARTFFRDAPLVILDEPAAALDAKAEHKLFADRRAVRGPFGAADLASVL